MTKALTPEEARAAADKIDQTADRTRHLADPIAATLRAYADQADALTRLAEYEESVGELLEARLAFGQAINERRLTDLGAETRLRDAFERLRALQEK